MSRYSTSLSSCRGEHRVESQVSLFHFLSRFLRAFFSLSSSPRSCASCSRPPQLSLCPRGPSLSSYSLSYHLLPVLGDTTTFAVTLMATVVRRSGSRCGSRVAG